MKSRHLLHALVGISLVSITAAACSSGDGMSLPTNDATVEASGDSSATDDTAATPVTEGAPSTESAPSTDSGDSGGIGEVDPGDNCHVEITGDVTTSWDSPGGYSAIGYGPWIPEGPAGSTGIELDETFFLLNCTGEGENYVGFGATLDSAIPMTPGTYPILPADNAFGGTEVPHQMDILLGLDGTGTNWGPSAEGTLVITEFDSEHIAGTFTVPITDVLARISGVSKGDAVVTGTFNYRNPNL